MPRDPVAEALLEQDTDPEMRWVDAQVSNITPLEVTIYAQAGIPASRLNAYAPSSGDQVWGQLVSGTRYIIHGRIISGG